MWAICIKQSDGKVRIVTEGEQICHDDPAYGDVHIVPFLEDGEYIVFGIHEFKRNCCCQPELKIEEGERPMVIHKDRKPN